MWWGIFPLDVEWLNYGNYASAGFTQTYRTNNFRPQESPAPIPRLRYLSILKIYPPKMICPKIWYPWSLSEKFHSKTCDVATHPPVLEKILIFVHGLIPLGWAPNLRARQFCMLKLTWSHWFSRTQRNLSLQWPFSPLNLVNFPMQVSQVPKPPQSRRHLPTSPKASTNSLGFTLKDLAFRAAPLSGGENLGRIGIVIGNGFWMVLKNGFISWWSQKLGTLGWGSNLFDGSSISNMWILSEHVVQGWDSCLIK